MTAIGNMSHTQEYVYDFAVDGGLQGEIVLSAKATKDPIPVGSIIKSVRAKVLTALTSGGAATLAWGNGDDADGYSGATAAVAGFTANALFNGWDNGSALLWDDANDHNLEVNVSTADDGKFEFNITDADLTAGVIVFHVDYYFPGEEV